MTLRIDSLITLTITLLVATTASAGGGALAALSEAYGAWDTDAYTQDCQYEDHCVRYDREATAAVDYQCGYLTGYGVVCADPAVWGETPALGQKLADTPAAPEATTDYLCGYLTGYGVRAPDGTVGAYVQYKETDFNFVCRPLAISQPVGAAAGDSGGVLGAPAADNPTRIWVFAYFNGGWDTQL